MLGPFDPARYPYTLPARGAPVRVAFVGSRPANDAHVLQWPVHGLAPAFVDVSGCGDADAVGAALEAASPHVVVVLAPGAVPSALLADLPAATLGFFSEAPKVEELAQYDRVIVCEPRLLAPEYEHLAWRISPLPVDDRIYMTPVTAERPRRAVFVGESSEYREHFLVQSKHEYDLLHYAHGLWGRRLRSVLAKVDIGVNVHRTSAPAFEPTVPLHLAAGHLLVSEPLRPSHGLRPEVHYLAVTGPQQLLIALARLRDDPRLHDRVRLCGRAQGEAFRASTMWPRLIADLVADVTEFGTARLTVPRRSAGRGG